MPIYKEKPRVLLVEDFAPNIMVASFYLESYGYLYDVAVSGPAAVEMARTTVYDVILMDVQLPDMNGFDATRIIRQNQRASGLYVPIIGITAHALKGDRERCLEVGMDDYISKPIVEAELQDKLALYIRLMDACD